MYILPSFGLQRRRIDMLPSGRGTVLNLDSESGYNFALQVDLFVPLHSFPNHSSWLGSPVGVTLKSHE